MLRPKDFLEKECENLQESLHEALRYDYGQQESDFYDECIGRLEYLHKEVTDTVSDDYESLNLHSDSIALLSQIIARFERSRLGEFSWPFAYSLNELAKAVCREKRTTSDNKEKITESIFSFFADGGFDYKIYPGQDEAEDTSFDQRIFNVVFPRTLKYQVLLHPILAHEIGHAAIDCVANPQGFPAIYKELFTDSVFDDIENTRVWIKTSTGEERKFGEIAASIEAWKTELICDLFGLVFFGPSFVAAHRALLGAIDPTNAHVGPNHPPNWARYHLLAEGIAYLGWNHGLQRRATPLETALGTFWDQVTQSTGHPVDGIFSTERIQRSTDILRQILDANGALYKLPAPSAIEKLLEQIARKTPPLDCEVDDDGNAHPRPVDFRDIIFSGWVSYQCDSGSPFKPNGISFSQLNRLCNHAIMQQIGIDTYTASP